MQSQISVHDWIGKTVWTREQGHLCPPLEKPQLGQTVVYIDYTKDLDESLVQADIELLIDKLGYPSGPRYIGESPLDPNCNVVSYVGTFQSDDVAEHLERLKAIAPIETIRTIIA